MADQFFEITSVSAGKDQTLALLSSGQVLGWGGAGSGRYVPPDIDISSTFNRADIGAVGLSGQSRYSDISAGYAMSLGVSRNQLFAWGFSQIGIGNSPSISEVPTLISKVKNINTVVAGHFLFGAIDQAGSLFTWGLNSDGALGRETPKINTSPEIIKGLPPIQQVVIGDQFMLALSRKQTIYAWGSNSAGQLGLGHLNTILQPELVEISAMIKNLAVGATHVLALCKDGKVYGWGSNHFGQLGNKRNQYFYRPIAIEFIEPIKAVAAGMHYSLALSISGKVYAFGWNGSGQLGLGDLETRSTPTLISNLSAVRSIAAGEMHAIAIGENHLYGWGNNANGQIGPLEAKQKTPSPFLRIAEEVSS